MSKRSNLFFLAIPSFCLSLLPIFLPSYISLFLLYSFFIPSSSVFSNWYGIIQLAV